jgi:hypothetical protein
MKRTIRLLRTLATDDRIPRPVRWLIGISLAVKAVPLPDFGIDEIGLLIAFVLLSTIYRNRFAEIREEIRDQERNRETPESSRNSIGGDGDSDRVVSSRTTALGTQSAR